MWKCKGCKFHFKITRPTQKSDQSSPSQSLTLATTTGTLRCVLSWSTETTTSRWIQAKTSSWCGISHKGSSCQTTICSRTPNGQGGVLVQRLMQDMLTPNSIVFLMMKRRSCLFTRAAAWPMSLGSTCWTMPSWALTSERSLHSDSAH